VDGDGGETTVRVHDRRAAIGLGIAGVTAAAIATGARVARGAAIAAPLRTRLAAATQPADATASTASPTTVPSAPGTTTSSPAAASTLPGGGASGWPGDPLATARGSAAHLLRRAWFGHTAGDLAFAASVPYHALVEHITNQTAAEPPLPAPGDRLSSGKVIEWWLSHMATTPSQFPERMTLFWHGLLTSDRSSGGERTSVLEQNRLYRRLGLGDLRTLLIQTTYDPLMMVWLNLNQSTAAAPNENYARELMELFTLGPGNYTETDVREGARALSGLQIQMVDAGGAVIVQPKGMTRDERRAWLVAEVSAGARWIGALVPRRHDGGVKTFLGRTGNLGPTDVIDAILAHDACAPFVTGRAFAAFGVAQPSPQTVARVAAAFRSSGYDIRTLMREVFLSDDFRAPTAYRSLVRSPIEVALAAVRSTGHPELSVHLDGSGLMGPMGQRIYSPPNVAGWPGGRAWIDSGSIVGRANCADFVTASARGALPSAADAVATQLDGVLSPATAAALAGCPTETDRWYVLLSSPEFQLK
jgi:uncharacterized protein (DUF1800 family)